jgi:hypothetical protein
LGASISFCLKSSKLVREIKSFVLVQCPRENF